MSAPERLPLLTFNGPVRISERQTADGERSYLVTPLPEAAVLEELAAARERAAWYAGADAVLREAQRLAVSGNSISVAIGRLESAVEALRYPKDGADV